jgi:hypothetical protein
LSSEKTLKIWLFGHNLFKELVHLLRLLKLIPPYENKEKHLYYFDLKIPFSIQIQ